MSLVHDVSVSGDTITDLPHVVNIGTPKRGSGHLRSRSMFVPGSPVRMQEGMQIQIKLPSLNTIVGRRGLPFDLRDRPMSPDSIISPRSPESGLHISQYQEGYVLRPLELRRSNPAIVRSRSLTTEVSRILHRNNSAPAPEWITPEKYHVLDYVPVVSAVIAVITLILGIAHNPYWWLCGLVLILPSYIFIHFRRRDLVGIVKAEREKRRLRSQENNKIIDQLLEDIYPAAVLSRVRMGVSPILDMYKNTTVLFTDIVGFTQWSSQLTPYALASKLNSIYSIFDYLSDRYNVYKVETIGDSYMAVSGCPIAIEDHALRIARFAISVLGAVDELRAIIGKPDLQVRVGLHSGAVVAGIVGTKRHHFHLFGDTVNVASRLESTGIPCKVHLSDSTYHELSGKLTSFERGNIELKGKGVHTTYLLNLPEWIGAYNWDPSNITYVETYVLASELLIRACALNTLACTVLELDSLVTCGITMYMNHPALRVRSVVAMHTIQRLLIDADMYQYMSEIEVLAVQLYAMCDASTHYYANHCTVDHAPAPWKTQLLTHPLIAKSTSNDELAQLLLLIDHNCCPINMDTLCQQLESLVQSIQTERGMQSDNMDTIFHKIFEDPRSRLILISATLRLALDADWYSKSAGLGYDSSIRACTERVEKLIGVLSTCINISQLRVIKFTRCGNL